MKKTSRRRPSLHFPSRYQWIFVALLIALASAGWSLSSGRLLRNTVSAQTGVVVANAASFARTVAPDSLAVAAGQFTTQNNQNFVAPSGVFPLPLTLGGVSISINGTTAGLLFVSPAQVNFVVPAGLADTPSATINVTNSDNSTRTGTFTIAGNSPGIFTVNSAGSGVPTALTTFDGLSFQTVFNPDLSAKAVDAGTRDRRNTLVLFATGVRNAPAGTVIVKFQGVPVVAGFAGAVSGFVALDQINATIPPELAGIGSIRVEVIANGRVANAVTISLGGQFPPVRLAQIQFGDTATGNLTPDDQVQEGDPGKTYFFDAYTFTTTAPNTTIAVDLRSPGFDAAVLLYRIENNALTTLLAVDDQSGGYGNGALENNNALLLTVLPTPGSYAIFATSSDVEPNGVGSYTLKLLSNVITPISYGQTTTGATIATTDLQTAAGTYLDAYWFSGTQGDRQQIRMSAAAPFDPFLILQRNDGDPPIAAADNGGGGTDALIDPTHGDVDGFPPIPGLPGTGIYIIIATPFELNRTGPYTLSLNRLTNFGPEAAIEASPSVSGRQIRDISARAVNFGGTSFERLGRRRIVKQ